MNHVSWTSPVSEQHYMRSPHMQLGLGMSQAMAAIDTGMAGEFIDDTILPAAL